MASVPIKSPVQIRSIFYNLWNFIQCIQSVSTTLPLLALVLSLVVSHLFPCSCSVFVSCVFWSWCRASTYANIFKSGWISCSQLGRSMTHSHNRWKESKIHNRGKESNRGKEHHTPVLPRVAAPVSCRAFGKVLKPVRSSWSCGWLDATREPL